MEANETQSQGNINQILNTIGTEVAKLAKVHFEVAANESKYLNGFLFNCKIKESNIDVCYSIVAPSECFEDSELVVKLIPILIDDLQNINTNESNINKIIKLTNNQWMLLKDNE